jgi:hypothetical protein
VWPSASSGDGPDIVESSSSKNLVFYHGRKAYTRRVGVKGLPQGSVLSPLLYNVGGAGIDSRLTRGVYDIVLYASGNILQSLKVATGVSEFG